MDSDRGYAPHRAWGEVFVDLSIDGNSQQEQNRDERSYNQFLYSLHLDFPFVGEGLIDKKKLVLLEPVDQVAPASALINLVVRRTRCLYRWHCQPSVS